MPTDPALYNASIERLLGVLIEKSATVEGQIAEVRRILDRKETAERAIEEKLDDLDDRMAAMEHAMTKTVPVVDLVERLMERWRGVMIVGALAVSAISVVGGLVMTIFGEQVLRLFR